jgi:hypothetical protein
LFFQAVLLAGYLYAHLGVRRLPPGAQALLHMAVLIAAVVLALPSVTPAARWQPDAQAGGADPTWRIILLLAATVGLPCVALAATSPLLHAWYGRIRPGAAVYRLYALSNAGSLLALLSYPVLVETLLSRAAQAALWSAGLCVFAALCGVCALIAWRHRAAAVAAPDNSGGRTKPALNAPNVPRVAMWIVLPACACALLLGTTNTITQDLAPVPLLWVLPLTLYLLTFIIAFDRPAWYVRPLWGTVLALGVAGSAGLLIQGGGDWSLPVIIGTFALTLFAGCMVMHGELARLRPPPSHLTGYYLAIATGGVIGGQLVAVVAPLVLTKYSEFPIALWTCCLLGFAAGPLAQRKAPSGIVIGLAVVGLIGGAAALWAADNRQLSPGAMLVRERDFYGVVSTWEVTLSGGKGVEMIHGGTLHGHQYRLLSLRTMATTYYHVRTGIGQLLGAANTPLPAGPRRIGGVGLGAGSIAVYARPGDLYRFYEISPAVAAQAEQHFTFLKDARDRGATVEIVLGDGRLSLAAESAGEPPLDVLVLDAFSSDAVPIHLLTTDAFEVYKRRLSPGGVMAVHVSNNYLDLEPVVAAAARRAGWHPLLYKSAPVDDIRAPAVWVLITPDAAKVDALRALGAALPPPEWGTATPWTDERANLLGVIREQ